MPPPVAVAIAVVSSKRERERCEGGGAVERSESERRGSDAAYHYVHTKGGAYR